jgi:hypothetical protein
MPSGQPPDDARAPVALWRDGELAAVLSLTFTPGSDVPLWQEISVFRRIDGKWAEGFSGGSSWPVRQWARPPRGPTLVALTGFSVASGHGSRPTIASGVASVAVHSVRVWSDDGPDEAVVDPSTGAFMFACDSLSQVQLSAVDGAGVELRGTG